MKKHTFLTLVLITLSLRLAYSQNFQCAKSFGGTLSDVGYAICTDNIGNNYITGGFKSSPAYFDTFTLNCSGFSNIYTLKTDPQGNIIWVKIAGGSDINYGSEAKSIINNSNDIFIAGSFPYNAVFDSINIVSNGNRDAFLAKYNNTGHCQWVKKMGGIYGDYAEDICLTFDQNILICGNFFSPIAHFDTIDLFGGGFTNEKIFIAKYDINGNCIWAKQSTSGFGWTSKLFTDNSRIFLTGQFGDSLTFGGFTITDNSQGDIFIASFDINGNIKWLNKAGGLSADVAFSICSDSNGNCYITGSFVDSATFGLQTVIKSSGGNDMFVAKYDSSGNCIWVKNLNCSGGAEGKDIISDGNNSCYVTGHFSGIANFGGNLVTALSPEDMFIARYDYNGNCLGIKHAANAVGYGLSLDNAGNCVITGTFTGSTNFGGINLTGHGNNPDIFLAKMDATLSIEEPNQNTNDQLVIYANPNTGTCNITVPEEFAFETTLLLSIYNQKGQLVQQQNLVMDANKIKLNMEQEAKGIYTATLSNGRRVFTGRVVFE